MNAINSLVPQNADSDVTYDVIKSSRPSILGAVWLALVGIGYSLADDSIVGKVEPGYERQNHTYNIEFRRMSRW